MINGRSKKAEREFQVLMGLVELYLDTGKPIGSYTLHEHDFKKLSSATIRNYFAELEKQGFLRQPHSSGGRIPTNDAFRLYANENFAQTQLLPEVEEKLQPLANMQSKNIATYLQHAAETLSQATNLATFLSSVRFDHDFIQNIKLLNIDSQRVLAVIVTNFGQILTEVLAQENKLSSFALKRIEAFIGWKVKGVDKPTFLSREEKKYAQKFYNEIVVRYLVRYSNFSDEDIFRTGFSRLLTYPEFNDPVALSAGLSLFENTSQMRLLLNDSAREGKLRFWIGQDLAPYAVSNQSCSVIAIPYFIGQTIVGSIGILGPCRLAYPAIFGALKYFSEVVSISLTKSLNLHKLSFRQPRTGIPYIQQKERTIVDQTSQKLLEVKE